MYRILIEPYKQIALRHLNMADALLGVRFHDGAAFHLYHAYESIVCAAILKRQPYDMPPLTHPGKLDRFRQIFARERQITAESTKLSGKLHPMRNRVLYPELRELFVIMPASAVSEKQVRRYLSQVKEFVNQLISQLRL
ncbi:MAG: HEPN domain-containing protein [Candidatus Poribacteria bacterium]